MAVNRLRHNFLCNNIGFLFNQVSSNLAMAENFHTLDEKPFCTQLKNRQLKLFYLIYMYFIYYLTNKISTEKSFDLVFDCYPDIFTRVWYCRQVGLLEIRSKVSAAMLGVYSAWRVIVFIPQRNYGMDFRFSGNIECALHWRWRGGFVIVEQASEKKLTDTDIL